ncbi:MAG: nucleotide exchange factor GrpE [Alphaproteobacteria bacterium]|nr:nucleotide exchange factor GrpE [Alphaproteobacteria bacterium]
MSASQTSDEELPPTTDDQQQDAQTAPEPDEAAQLKDQLLRAMAETENTRRRLQKEIEEAKAYGMVNFAREMLAVADNLGRALQAAQESGKQSEAFKSLVQGVEATQRQLTAAFEKFSVKKMESLGKPFDPNFHQVMTENEDPSKPAGMIIAVLQDGYMIKDRLLREAMVAVAKGGPPKTKVDTSA